MESELTEVMEHIKIYFSKNLHYYEVLKVRRKSCHPDDSHLYMVSAVKKDGTYAVWTCWNEATGSLNHGHYGLLSEQDCEKVFEEYYYSGPDNQCNQKGQPDYAD